MKLQLYMFLTISYALQFCIVYAYKPLVTAIKKLVSSSSHISSTFGALHTQPIPSRSIVTMMVGLHTTPTNDKPSNNFFSWQWLTNTRVTSDINSFEHVFDDVIKLGKISPVESIQNSMIVAGFMDYDPKLAAKKSRKNPMKFMKKPHWYDSINRT